MQLVASLLDRSFSCTVTTTRAFRPRILDNLPKHTGALKCVSSMGPDIDYATTRERLPSCSAGSIASASVTTEEQFVDDSKTIHPPKIADRQPLVKRSIR